MNTQGIVVDSAVTGEGKFAGKLLATKVQAPVQPAAIRPAPVTDEPKTELTPPPTIEPPGNWLAAVSVATASAYVPAGKRVGDAILITDADIA